MVPTIMIAKQQMLWNVHTRQFANQSSRKYSLYVSAMPQLVGTAYVAKCIFHPQSEPSGM
jgi:hypothetical protein